MRPTNKMQPLGFSPFGWSRLVSDFFGGFGAAFVFALGFFVGFEGRIPVVIFGN